jgi:hypothetical protein
MPDVAGGWLRSLLRMLGGILGREILYLGVAGLDTPIWDVLALQGEEEEALNRLRMGSISPGFPIRQAVPLGLARAWFCCWARWAWFLMQKKKILLATVYLHTIHLFLCVGGGDNGWMAVNSVG